MGVGAWLNLDSRLRQSASRRDDSAAQLADDVRRHLLHEPVKARPQTLVLGLPAPAAMQLGNSVMVVRPSVAAAPVTCRDVSGLFGTCA